MGEFDASRHEGVYQCLATSSAGSLLSRPATLEPAGTVESLAHFIFRWEHSLKLQPETKIRDPILIRKTSLTAFRFQTDRPVSLTNAEKNQNFQRGTESVRPSVCLLQHGPTAADPLMQGRRYRSTAARPALSNSGWRMRAVPRCQRTSVAEHRLVKFWTCRPVGRGVVHWVRTHPPNK